MVIKLPVGLCSNKIVEKLRELEEATYSTIRFKHVAGTICQLEFSTRKLSSLVSYDKVPKDGHKIPLKTAFGTTYIDFEDEGSYHMLVGGATRMGKSKFIELLIYHTLVSYRDWVKFYVVSPKKMRDFYMFLDIPQIDLAETFDETREVINSIFAEMEIRKALVTKGQFTFDPIFLVIDEFGRFSDEEDILNNVTEIVETAGYLNIHVILASQRPDASTVLKPRIRANLLVNMAFTTRDEANSRIIIGSPDASNLGKIKGRAILVDGFQETVQIPLLENIEEKLKEFKSYDESRQIDHEVASPLPSFIKGSVRGDDLP